MTADQKHYVNMCSELQLMVPGVSTIILIDLYLTNFRKNTLGDLLWKNGKELVIAVNYLI